MKYNESFCTRLNRVWWYFICILFFIVLVCVCPFNSNICWCYLYLKFKFRNLINVIILGQPKSDNNKHDNDNIN
jgi:hypothetical protein